MSKKNKNKSNKTGMNAISTIISFLLSIFLTLICYLCGTYFGLFNKALILDAMNKSSYYESVNSYTYDEAVNLAIPANLNESIFDGVFSLNDTYREGKAYLEATLNGEHYTIDTTKIRSKLSENIKKYIAESNISPDAYNDNNINTFIDDVCRIYVSNLAVPYLSYYNGIKSMFKQIMLIGLPVLIILSLISIFLLTKTQKWIHRSLRYVAYSFLAAALMTTIMPAFLLITGGYSRLNLSPEFFSRLLSKYLGQSLMMYIYTSVIMLSAALIVILLVYYTRKKIVR
ncbi:MAG: hypothetical protein Q4F06_08110 [Eubacteriales bacterium]|nr:hypothetical protein [Eubacteriales bacterium]